MFNVERDELSQLIESLHDLTQLETTSISVEGHVKAPTALRESRRPATTWSRYASACEQLTILKHRDIGMFSPFESVTADCT